MDKVRKAVAWFLRTYLKEMVGKWVVFLVATGGAAVMGWLESLPWGAIGKFVLLGLMFLICLVVYDQLCGLYRRWRYGQPDDVSSADPISHKPEFTAPKEPDSSSQDHGPAVSERGADELPFQAFDTPILEAINYVIENALHSYKSTGPAQRSAFKSLHKLMCDGLLQVIGRETEFGPFREIPQSECRDLVPKEVCIPPSEAAPDGVRFSLMHLPDNNQLSLQELQKWAGKTRELQDLYMRSVDLYRHFPKKRGDTEVARFP